LFPPPKNDFGLVFIINPSSFVERDSADAVDLLNRPKLLRRIDVSVGDGVVDIVTFRSSLALVTQFNPVFRLFDVAH